MKTDDFDKTFDRTWRAFMVMTLLIALASIGFIAVLGWAVVSLVAWMTG